MLEIRCIQHDGTGEVSTGDVDVGLLADIMNVTLDNANRADEGPSSSGATASSKSFGKRGGAHLSQRAFQADSVNVRAQRKPQRTSTSLSVPSFCPAFHLACADVLN